MTDGISDAHKLPTSLLRQMGHVDWSEVPWGGLVEQALAKMRQMHEALEMVRDADDDCKRDGRPTMPPLPRAKIDAALA